MPVHLERVRAVVWLTAFILLGAATPVSAFIEPPRIALAGEGAVWFSFDAGPNAQPGSFVIVDEGVKDVYMSWFLIYRENGTLEFGILVHYLLGRSEFTVEGERPVGMPSIDVRPLAGGTFETMVGLGPTDAPRTLVLAFGGGEAWNATISGTEGSAASPAFVTEKALFATTRDFERGAHAKVGAFFGGARVDQERALAFETKAPFFIGFSRLTTAPEFNAFTQMRLEGPSGAMLEGDVYELDLSGPRGLPVGDYVARVDDVDIGAGVVFLFAGEPDLSPTGPE